MRRIAAAFLIFVAIVAAGFVMTRDRGEDVAYAEAEARIAQGARERVRVLSLQGLDALEKIPPSISDLDRLAQLSLRGTRVSDLAPLAAVPSLRVLSLRDTRAGDLAPLEALSDLEILDLAGSWVWDLGSLSRMPSLERLDLGGTMILSLEPAVQAERLKWINLHGAQARDGSGEHFESLLTKGVALNNGRTFREDRASTWVGRQARRLGRLTARLSPSD